MASYNWDDGRLVTFGINTTLTCAKLMPGQLYALVFYNSSGINADTTIGLDYSRDTEYLTLPGTARNKGLATVAFVSGDETNRVSALIMGGDNKTSVTAYIASVSMPTYTGNINNIELYPNGYEYPFYKFTRFFTVPESHQYAMTISSTINKFIFFQMRQNAAEVFILNSDAGGGKAYIHCLGKTDTQVTIKERDSSSIYWTLRGDGTQTTFFNADSAQNSGDAHIRMQSFSAVFADVNEEEK